MSHDIVVQLKELAAALQRGEGRSTVIGASSEIARLQADRDLWKELAVRAYKKTFNVDQDYSDAEVWTDIEDAYEGSDTVE